MMSQVMERARELIREVGGSLIILKPVRNGNQYVAKPIDETGEALLEMARGMYLNVLIITEDGQIGFIAKASAFHGKPAIYLPRRLGKLIERYWLEDKSLLCVISILKSPG